MKPHEYDDQNPYHLRERADAFDAKGEGVQVQFLNEKGEFWENYTDLKGWNPCTTTEEP